MYPAASGALDDQGNPVAVSGALVDPVQPMAYGVSFPLISSIVVAKLGCTPGSVASGGGFWRAPEYLSCRSKLECPPYHAQQASSAILACCTKQVSCEAPCPKCDSNRREALMSALVLPS